MHPAPAHLLNTEAIELVPAALLRARSNADARQLARATWLLRRKRDGRYLATATVHRVQALVPRLMHEPGIDAALDRLDALAARRWCGDAEPLPLSALHARLAGLGLDAADYARTTQLSIHAEPATLHAAGYDRYRRPLWLSAGAARAWRHLRSAAAGDDIVLDAISGYRSHDYQLGIFERKFARGLTLAQILAVNAAPGFSEHHSGDALDIGTPGEPPAEESFEITPAFAWLRSNAHEFGYRLSYPRNNPHGIVYEPWHWRWSAT
ncbi:D-alanyl-D-alanine carboxypeptidase family protein [Xanthomonas prunicola]|uniref:D-alanyl-D-alanine carboxypeptidase family protein n=1 Tax=Xanthomonas prunicola TaxID=2053930 RepID=A0A9Q9J5C0_9XANT|nr:M15 family metallopeptidase [Xanthomonas prunicola]USJ01328.1 D-alanyl-D-alanine carboxypeptidase family protein [Xanthomonas prunicola]UXA49865.1 D-alanyl-D-alanine carboxypeptidase family protein [Xanthomonas prunicola]UXA58162.1 D-alanyl-D-alanine carboxypeptidase family protein [Xanthomonas prunicola]UXA60311.1 D-alanyl-D-alanine carboxypeptidase family protein [Xanthomonas prunicola]UXA66376.1 D-alanyl-D-alanine carboxypeptidase family protein [Xanthomonas prunicola]